MIKTYKTSNNKWHTIMPLFFVILYGSGFVGAKLGLPYADPLTFLAYRFFISVVLLIFISLIFKSTWPKSIKEIIHLCMAGILTIGVFSVGVFEAINLGIPPALSALIIALQPIVVTLAAGPFLGEKTSWQQWCGLILGLIGVSMVVSHKLHFNHANMVGIIMSLIGLLGLASGNLYQKKFCSTMNIFTGGVVQSAAAAITVFVLALLFERMHVVWNTQFIFALIWMSIIVSIGALSILYLLIRHGEASQVASIFYLVPVATAIMSYLIYKDVLDWFGMLGVAVTALGVILVNKKRGK